MFLRVLFVINETTFSACGLITGSLPDQIYSFCSIVVLSALAKEAGAHKFSTPALPTKVHVHFEQAVPRSSVLEQGLPSDAVGETTCPTARTHDTELSSHTSNHRTKELSGGKHQFVRWAAWGLGCGGI